MSDHLKLQHQEGGFRMFIRVLGRFGRQNGLSQPGSLLIENHVDAWEMFDAVLEHDDMSLVDLTDSLSELASIPVVLKPNYCRDHYGPLRP